MLTWIIKPLREVVEWFIKKPISGILFILIIVILGLGHELIIVNADKESIELQLENCHSEAKALNERFSDLLYGLIERQQNINQTHQQVVQSIDSTLRKTKQTIKKINNKIN